jgi:hypothetical protein
MESKAAIVAGGGWGERRDCRVKFKAVACLVLSVPALAFSDNLADHVGAWSVCIPAVLITAAAILFWFERPAIFWGFPDVPRANLTGRFLERKERAATGKLPVVRKQTSRVRSTT